MLIILQSNVLIQTGWVLLLMFYFVMEAMQKLLCLRRLNKMQMGSF